LRILLLYLVSDIAVFALKRDVKLQPTKLLLYLLLLPFVVNKSYNVNRVTPILLSV